MKARAKVAAIGAALLIPVSAGAQLKELENILKGKGTLNQAIKGVAIAYAVRQSSKQLNQFINTLTLRNKVPQSLATKVVPVLTAGERGYVGGAQVVGPRALVDKVQVVWQYEEGFQRGEFKIRALVPSSDINPLKLRRVEKVSLGALIDVDLGNGFESNTRSGGIGASRVLRAAAVAGVVLAAAKPLNQFINTITMNKGQATKVVPQASFGETAYIGGAQVTGAAAAVNQTRGVFEYWDAFDKGRFRVRALVPVNGVDPTKIRRVEGVGVTAVIQTSIAEQKSSSAPRPTTLPRRDAPAGSVISIPTPRRDDDDAQMEGRHDRGLHLGWERGKHKGWDKQKKKKRS